MPRLIHKSLSQKEYLKRGCIAAAELSQKRDNTCQPLTLFVAATKPGSVGQSVRTFTTNERNNMT